MPKTGRKRLRPVNSLVIYGSTKKLSRAHYRANWRDSAAPYYIRVELSENDYQDAFSKDVHVRPGETFLNTVPYPGEAP